MDLRKFKPDKFQLYEWLPEMFYMKFYPVYGENLWWMLLTYKIRYTAHKLRQRYGPMTMNDWKWRKGDPNKNQYRGYRPLDCKIGAKLSQHKVGNALDAKFKYVSSDQIRSDIIADPYHEDFKYITCLELNISWLHADCRPYDKKTHGILRVYP